MNVGGLILPLTGKDYFFSRDLNRSQSWSLVFSGYIGLFSSLFFTSKDGLVFGNWLSSLRKAVHINIRRESQVRCDHG